MLNKTSYENCRLCPRECGADRLHGNTGYCAMPGQAVLGLAAPHYWEEPCICGPRGVGAVFFSGCALRCAYCQNQKLTAERFGAAVSVARLREIFWELIEQGVSGIDLVNPSHFAPDVAAALEQPLPVPVIYNCGGYESNAVLRELAGKIDVYLPDLKYADSSLAAALSQAPDYFARAKDAIMEMYAQTGDYQLDEQGMLKKGLLIRHLVLPGQPDNTFDIIDWVVENFRPGSVLFSLMGQYIPCGDLRRFPELRRRLTAEEYQRAADYLLALGWEDGYVQEPGSADDEYVPVFDLTGVIKKTP